MIQNQSLLNISDNSGCKIGRCIKVFKKKVGFCGDLILISIRKIKIKKKSKLKIEKGDKMYAVVLRTKSKFKRKNSSFIKFNGNFVSPLNKQLRPIATRIFGPVLRELRKSKFMKVASLSKGFV